MGAWCLVSAPMISEAQSEHADHAGAMVRATKPIANMTGTVYLGDVADGNTRLVEIGNAMLHPIGLRSAF
jgi:hypothetical protein